MADFEKRCGESFRFGRSYASLSFILGVEAIKKVCEKFKEESNENLYISTKELVKYLFLAAHSNRSLFFPGNKLMDDIWHVLILETKLYREVCDRIKPHSFIDHTGTKFSDYSSMIALADLHEEQCAWLSSYVFNFGEIQPSAFVNLPMAQSMSDRIGADLEDLNELAKALIEIGTLEQEKRESFDFNNFVLEVSSVSNRLDTDFSLMGIYIQKLVRNVFGNRSEDHIRFANHQLEKLFGASTAFGFTFWQHLAAMERLDQSSIWQSSNPELWKQLYAGRSSCGLATTHLARPGGSSVQAIQENNSYLISGTAPWVCGYQIFDHLLLGFETADSILFGVIDFPTQTNPSTNIERYDLICLNGASTVRIDFHKFSVPITSIVSERKKGAQVVPRSSQYVTPEIGIGKSVLRLVTTIIEQKQHPKNEYIRACLGKMRHRAESFDLSRMQEGATDKLIVDRDNFNRDAIRLLSIACGAQAMEKGSIVSRLYQEMILLDSVVQAPSTIQQKLLKIGREK